jgi:hypothetical protein
MKVVILAGGLGTRISDSFQDRLIHAQGAILKYYMRYSHKIEGYWIDKQWK